MKKTAICFLLAVLLLVGGCNTAPTEATTESAPEPVTPTETKPETDKPTETTVKETEPVNTTPSPTEYKALNYSDVKAMWLSQYDLSAVYSASGEQRSKADFTARIKAILKKVKELGINTVYIQVRPFGDSFYPSEIYPASYIVSGKYGRELKYDPFEIIVDACHALELSVHAWINPLRLMESDNISLIDEKFDIKKWYSDRATKNKYVVNVSGRLYLNPAYGETRDLICRGAREIVEMYNVDGVHIDDYFYPTQDTGFDLAAYTVYKRDGGTLSLEDFRRDNINRLVSEIYSTVKSVNETVLFGVSPAGNMANNYNKLYADVATWCANDGYIDYICPQVYFGFEHATCAYDKVCTQFSDMIKTDNIKLIVGVSLGKAKSEYDQYAGDGKYEWRDHKDILKRQLEYTKTLDTCTGVAYFCYQYFYDPVSGAKVSETAAEVDGLIPLLKTISWSE